LKIAAGVSAFVSIGESHRRDSQSDVEHPKIVGKLSMVSAGVGRNLWDRDDMGDGQAVGQLNLACWGESKGQVGMASASANGESTEIDEGRMKMQASSKLGDEHCV
jgi:hypothetical protein